MKIRQLKKSEINSAAHIIGINYSKTYERLAQTEMSAMFGKGPILPKYVVAEEKGKLIGVAGYIQSWMDYNIYQIFWVNVLPNYQRKGIGKQLVAKIISEIKKKKDANLILLTADTAVRNHRVGGIIGIILGVSIALLINATGITQTTVTVYSVVLSFAVSAIIGIIFGYYPAKKASELNPIEALRYE